MALGQRQALPGQIRALRKYELAISPSFRDIPRGSFNSGRVKVSGLLRRTVKTNLHFKSFLLLLTSRIWSMAVISSRSRTSSVEGEEKFSNHTKLESEMFYEAETNRGNTQLFPPEYFLFNLTFPSCTSVVFCNKDVQFSPWPDLKGAFSSPYVPCRTDLHR